MRETILREGPRIRRALLLALIVLIPLVFMRNLSDPINIPKLGVLIVGVSVVAAIRVAEILQTRDVTGFKLLSIPAAALATPLVVGWAFSPYKGWALWGVYPRMLGLLPYLFVILFGVLIADAFRGDADPVAWAMLGAGGVAGAYAVIQFVGLDPFEWSVKGSDAEGLVVSTLGNPNFAGAFFATVMPLGLTLLLLKPERRIAAGAATALAAAGWLAAGSEAAWVAGVAGVAVVVGFLLVRRWRFARVAAAVFVGSLAVVVVGSVGLAIADVAKSKIPATIQRRADWWEAAIDMAAASPIVGRGPNAFALEHPQYRTEEDVRQVGLDITDDPHSVFLSFVTSAGLIGAIGYLIAVGWVVKTTREIPSTALLAAGFLGALTAYFIQSLVSIDTVALRAAGWVSIAGLAATRVPPPEVPGTSRTKRKRSRQEPLRALPAIGLVTVLGLTGVWAGTQLILKDAAFLHAAHLLRDGEGQPALDAYEDSISFSGNVHYRRSYGNVLGDVAVAVGPEGDPFINQAVEAFDFVERLPQVHAALDLAATLKDWAAIDRSAVPDAVQAYLRAVRYDPIDTALLTDVSSALLDLEADQETVTLLEPVVERFASAELWGNFALAQARLGESDEALEAIARALALAPEDPKALQAQEILKGSAPSP